MQFITTPTLIPSGERYDALLQHIDGPSYEHARQTLHGALQEAFDLGMECERGSARTEIRQVPAPIIVTAPAEVKGTKLMPKLRPFHEIMDEGPATPAEWLVKLGMPENMAAEQFYELVTAALKWAATHDA